jgi:hypothetical protein
MADSSQVKPGILQPTATVSVDPNDMTNQYNTKLSPADETRFQQWAKANPRLGNTYDYDSRGFWLSGAKQAANGHGSDEWKKPNHTTFSDLSRYNGVDGYQGGHWAQQKDNSYTFTPSQTNLKFTDPDDLRSYFSKQEKGNLVILPAQTSTARQP